MCPAADRGSDMEALKATFVMTNVVPQSPANNARGGNNWSPTAAVWPTQGKELYVVAGPHGQGGDR